MVLFSEESPIVTRFRLLFVCCEIFSFTGSILRGHFFCFVDETYFGASSLSRFFSKSESHSLTAHTVVPALLSKSSWHVFLSSITKNYSGVCFLSVVSRMSRGIYVGRASHWTTFFLGYPPHLEFLFQPSSSTLHLGWPLSLVSENRRFMICAATQESGKTSFKTNKLDVSNLSQNRYFLLRVMYLIDTESTTVTVMLERE